MFCSNCGKLLDNNERFCTKCGNKNITYQGNQDIVEETNIFSQKTFEVKDNMNPESWQHLSILMSFVCVVASFVNIVLSSDDGLSMSFNYPRSLNLFAIYYYFVPLFLTFAVCTKYKYNKISILLFPLILDVVLYSFFVARNIIQMYHIISIASGIALIWFAYKACYLPEEYAKKMYYFGIIMAALNSIFIFIPDMEYYSVSFGDFYIVSVSSYLREVSPFLCFACMGKEMMGYMGQNFVSKYNQGG